MSVVEEIRRDREDLARVLKKYGGIRRIVEDLYPDSAHFIYELLQNAEDTGATEAHFKLRDNSLIFEHNGRPFEPCDIRAITNIGEGTKAGDDDKIGRFGVGFKAVFAYSETPRIWSPTFSFQITDLVLPHELEPVEDLEGRTRFEFPFDNPKKLADEAFVEVKKGLSELPETTILFLSHLTSISWEIGENETGNIFREQYGKNHFEVFKLNRDKTTSSSHFLKFDRSVKGLEKQRLAIAFELDFLPNVQAFTPETPLAKQLRVIPANPGRVAVFFPAEKEVSNLRFHLHAPFVPVVSRASIKETPANLPLFEQLAALAAFSLHQIRDLGLLTAEFLEVLPNDRDPIENRYHAIRSKIIDEMNDQPLTPTQSKSHAPARNLLQGKASLKSLLSDEDIEFLIDHDGEPKQWAIGVNQKHSTADHFLESLAVEKWDIDDFVELLRNTTASPLPFGPTANISTQDVMNWLHHKPVDWHQELYALLQTDHLVPAGNRSDIVATKLKSLRIVRLTDGSYGIGRESFFASDGIDHDEMMGRVDLGVYTTGKSKAQKDNARAFLEQIGVRELGEAELVENILRQRYTKEVQKPDDKTHWKDLARFVELVEKEPKTSGLFWGSFIFNFGEIWRTPEEVFLDQPFLDTGLSAYYVAFGEQAARFALSASYESCGICGNRLLKFLQAVGATEKLKIQQTICSFNPAVKQLVHDAPGRWSRHGINVDFTIPKLNDLLQSQNATLSRLIWRTLCEQKDDSWTIAKYQINGSSTMRTAPSQLVCVLRNRAWIPQVDGSFLRPREASRDRLLPGFAFDPGWKWLQAIEFGQELAKKSTDYVQRQALAKQLGFNDEDTLNRAKQFAALPADEQRSFLAARECQASFNLPNHEPVNPERRSERVSVQAADAPERLTEQRTRSVTVGLNDVKQEAGQYLRQQYTNNDGQMICQVCKNSLPFKLDDGSYYFERVELLHDLKRRHYQNYLALCPNHGAMFQHANGSTENLRDQLIELEENELMVVLAREDAKIYFTKVHLEDLKAIIKADAKEPETIDKDHPSSIHALSNEH